MSVEKVWLTVAEVRERTGRGKRTILDALRAGELRGSQPGRGGHWRVHIDAVDSWMRGEVAPVPVPIVTRRRAS